MDEIWQHPELLGNLVISQYLEKYNKINPQQSKTKFKSKINFLFNTEVKNMTGLFAGKHREFMISK